MAQIESILFGNNWHGKLGRVVFRRSATGVQILEREAPHNPRTAAQKQARARMTAANQAWSQLSYAEAMAWRFAALDVAAATGQPALSGQQYFIRLAVRRLLADPHSPLPTTPPTEAFLGDRVRVTVEPAPRAIRFVADQPCAPGVVAELLAQRIAHPNRSASPLHYRTQAVSGFGEGLTVDARVLHGNYACAMRFIDAATGQATGLVEIGRVVVA